MSPADNALVERDFKVDALRSHLLRGEEGLNDFPVALLRVIEEEAWRDRVDWRSKERFAFSHFAEFVVAEAPAGLGADVALVRRMVRGTPTELPLAEALKGRSGGQTKAQLALGLDNAKGRQANSRGYLLRRLHRDHPALYERVEAGELTPNAAAVMAGFRRAQRTVPVDSPENAVRVLLRVFTADELRQALDEASR